jgi:uncharacterized protein (DUF1684 family)
VTFDADWAAWRQARESALRDPHGWLAITAIHWLSDQPQRFPDVPGEWTGLRRGAVLVLDAHEEVTVGAARMTAGRHPLGPLGEVGLTLSFGDAIAHVSDRGGATAVRPRHPDSANLGAYLETPCYPPDRRWIVSGHFEGSPATDLADPEELAGDIVFEFEGSEHRLAARRLEGGSLWVILRDGTSGRTTYGASRQLVVPAPGPDGEVVIDLNRVYNMPCAYTEFAICPVAPAQNTLPFLLEAGEQLPKFAG